jgi:hypothetical protein
VDWKLRNQKQRVREWIIYRLKGWNSLWEKRSYDLSLPKITDLINEEINQNNITVILIIANSILIVLDKTKMYFYYFFIKVNKFIKYI